MNDTPAIELKDIGVRYRIYREKVYSLKEAIIGSARRLGGIAAGQGWEPGFHEFWAIRNINLQVMRGQSLGLTGLNGSGKSTSLKVVAGVLHPTEGEMWVRGRVSALIELGAGFDPNLTGRENIYFGASVAGLSRKETDKRIDRIIDFSELGDFIDVPIRNYSSGMHARLGFALATDVDPDILIIDEILAVGDAPFQDKCKVRMEDFKRRNKTILFVSHDAQSVARFCDSTVLLEHGRIVAGGKI
jgi:ABC-type polysaccharide/polyol phosphate transport system ATPase subunit